MNFNFCHCIALVAIPVSFALPCENTVSFGVIRHIEIFVIGAFSVTPSIPWRVHQRRLLYSECVATEGRTARQATLVYSFLGMWWNEEALEVHAEYSRILIFTPKFFSAFPLYGRVTPAYSTSLSLNESQCVALVVAILMEMLRAPAISWRLENQFGIWTRHRKFGNDRCHPFFLCLIK